MIRFFIGLACIFFLEGYAEAAVPTLVHDHFCADTEAPVTNQVINNPGYDCQLLGPSGSLSGNAVFAIITFSITSPVTVTPSNDKVDSFTTVVTRTHTQQAEFTGIYCTMATAGSRKYTFSFSNTGQARNVRISLLEFNNVTSCTKTTSGSADSGAGTTSTSVASSSMTPATNDLLIQAGVTDNRGSNTTWTAGSQANITWVLEGADINVHPWAIQWGQYTTNTAISPTMTMDAGAFNTVAASMPTSATGTAASSFRISHVQNMNTQDESSGTVKLNFPVFTSGAIVVITQVNETGYDISSIADTPGSTYTKIGNGESPCGSCSGSSIWYAKNVSASAANIITLTMTGSSGGSGSTFVVYELDGGDTSAPLDTALGTSGYISQNGTQTAGSGHPDVTMCSACVTPASGEIVITAAEVAQNSITGVSSPSVAVYSGTTFTPRTVPDFGDENNEWAIAYADGSAETWTFQQDGSNTPGIGVWYWNAAAFKAASATSAQFPQVFVIRPF